MPRKVCRKLHRSKNVHAGVMQIGKRRTHGSCRQSGAASIYLLFTTSLTRTTRYRSPRYPFSLLQQIKRAREKRFSREREVIAPKHRWQIIRSRRRRHYHSHDPAHLQVSDSRRDRTAHVLHFFAPRGNPSRVGTSDTTELVASAIIGQRSIQSGEFSRGSATRSSTRRRPRRRVCTDAPLTRYL